MAGEPGELIRHFTVRTIDGGRFDYAAIWQRRNLLLLIMPDCTPSEPLRRYISQLEASAAELAALETTCVVTCERISSLPVPAVVIADRWGEIRLSRSGREVEELPTIADLLERLQGIEHECPECQGETH